MAGAFDPEDAVDDERVGLEHVDVLEEDDLDEDFDDEDDFDDEEDDELEELDDATDDDIDFVIALYREDGAPTVVPLEADLANDLEELIAHLQRLPGDAGSIGFVSLNREVLVAVQVRGPRHVQVLTSDLYYADVWPIVRDVADYLGVEPGEDDTPEEGPFGDLDMFASQGLKEEGLEALCLEEDDLASDELAERIARAIRFDPAQFGKVIDEYWDVEDD
jgi:putative tRNA adenosine deaminase-associated protein